MPFEDTPTSSSSDDNIALLMQRLSCFETEEGRLSGLNYVPHSPNEVLISTSPKAGTTWLQQICHQLRSAKDGGDMTFEEISEVVPWLELAYDQGQDLNGPQYGHDKGIPRIFKTHAWEGHCPKGCKVIVVLRDPIDVVVSFYNFFSDWFFEAGTVSLDDFIREFWLQRGVPTSKMNNASYFVHLTSWYKRMIEDKNVLILFFEDLKDDLKTQIRRVAMFISTDEHDFTSDVCIDLAMKHSSFAFMKQHQFQFDEKLSKIARNAACGLPPDAGLRLNKDGPRYHGKVNNGSCGKGADVLSQEVQEEIQAKWIEVVHPVTGCITYQELRELFSQKYLENKRCCTTE